MNHDDLRNDDLAGLDELIERICADACGEDEQLWAFRQAFEDDVKLPADGFVIGEPVSVVEIGYDGNTRRGLTAKCRRADGAVHVVGACDVTFMPGASGAQHLAAYRKWLGLDPWPVAAPAASRGRARHKATAEDIDLSKPVELVVLSRKTRSARCRLAGSARVVTLKCASLWSVVPGEIVTVMPNKHWNYGGHPYLSGEIQAARLDVAALGMTPLRLNSMGTWDPAQHYWAEDDEPIGEWARPIIARGTRPAFEMEQILPGDAPGDPDSDPVSEAVNLRHAGEHAAAEDILMRLCESDLRCLDAHSHLGHFDFDAMPMRAIRHYEMGLRIGELSLGDGFDGVLEWGCVDNRPFLRCLQGYARCLWRMRRFDEAKSVFLRMLWLNPSDNQGVRFLLEDVAAGKPWEEIEPDVS